MESILYIVQMRLRGRVNDHGWAPIGALVVTPNTLLRYDRKTVIREAKY